MKFYDVMHTVVSCGLAYILCLLIAVVVYFLCQKTNYLVRLWSDIGKYTLAIYLIHCLGMEIHRHYFLSITFFENMVALHVFTAVAVLFCSYGIAKLLNMNKITRYLFLGKNK